MTSKTRIPEIHIVLEKGILYIKKPKGCVVIVEDRDNHDDSVTTYQVNCVVDEVWTPGTK